MTHLLARILERLGLSDAPPPTLEGLHATYAAWCAGVPFDNVRKMIALRAVHHRTLPGTTAEDFFEAWLATGAGGTCWPTSNALFELVAALGFNARRVAGSMRDMGVINQRLYARRNHPGELVVVVGHGRFSKTARGIESRDLTRDEVRSALRDDIGLADALIDEWVACGGLDASFEPQAGPKPPPITRQPPSLRQGPY